MTAKDWKDHNCRLTMLFNRAPDGKVAISFDFEWRYSMLRPGTISNVEAELADLGHYIADELGPRPSLDVHGQATGTRCTCAYCGDDMFDGLQILS